MALATSNLKISAISSEFGLTSPHSMSELYSDEGTASVGVPAGTKNNAGVVVPTSGSIKASNFHGTEKAVFSEVAISLADSAVDTADALCSATFKRDGTVTDHNGTSLGDWVLPRHSTIGDYYQIRQLNRTQSGAGTYIGYGSNVDINSNRVFSLAKTSIGAVSTTMDIQIRQKNNTGIIRSFRDFDLASTVTSGEAITWNATAVTIADANGDTIALTLNNNGSSSTTSDVGIIQDWLSNAPSGTGSSYWMKWVRISGPNLNSLPGSSNVYQGLGTNRTFSKTGSSLATNSVYDITIATSSGGAGAVTKRVTFQQDGVN